MIGEEPRTPWTDYREKAGTIQYVDEAFKKVCPEGKQLWRLRPDAPDDVKRAFERRFTGEIRGSKEFIVPDMKDPYYTWEGKIVERSSLEGRELPLVK